MPFAAPRETAEQERDQRPERESAAAARPIGTLLAARAPSAYVATTVAAIAASESASPKANATSGSSGSPSARYGQQRHAPNERPPDDRGAALADDEGEKRSHSAGEPRERDDERRVASRVGAPAQDEQDRTGRRRGGGDREERRGTAPGGDELPSGRVEAVRVAGPRVVLIDGEPARQRVPGRGENCQRQSRRALRREARAPPRRAAEAATSRPETIEAAVADRPGRPVPPRDPASPVASHRRTSRRRSYGRFSCVRDVRRRRRHDVDRRGGDEPVARLERRDHDRPRRHAARALARAAGESACGSRGTRAPSA